MDTLADLIDAAKSRTGATYTEIGERLDRSKQLVSNWRSGEKVPTDGDVMALARMAGQDMDKWLAVAQAARSEGEAKSRWEQIAKRLAASAAAVLCAIGFSGAVAPEALAHKGFAPAVTQSASEECLLCKVDPGWWWKLLRDWLAWKLRGSKSDTGSLDACHTA